MALLRRLIERLSRPAGETRAEHLREWVAALDGVIPINQAKPRNRCRVAGIIRNIRIDPRQGTGSIEATITDGTGQMVAKWLGRASMSGIQLGEGLIMTGTPGVGEQGELVILNPEYELCSGPEHR
jgi:hypothetical protein